MQITKASKKRKREDSHPLSLWSHKRTASAVALALACTLASAADAQVLGRIYVFGDSSADLGTQGPERRPTNVGPMWSEAFANALGRRVLPAIDLAGQEIALTGGTSYAINGSTIVRYENVATFSDQLDLFESRGDRFGSSDLVFTWFTRNDITSAFLDGKEYDPVVYAESYLEGITRARSLGARNMVAFGAEIGLLSDAFAIDSGFPPEALDLLRETTRITEAELWPRLSAANVFIIDINRLGDSIIDDPGRFGFTSTTDSYQGRGAERRPEQSYPNDGNVFTAGGHFTSQMQGIISDFTLAQLRARDDYAQSLSAFTQQHDIALRDFTGKLRVEGVEAWSSYASFTDGETKTDAKGGLGRDLEGMRTNLQFGLVRVGQGWTFGAGIDLRRSRLEAESSFFADRRDRGISTGLSWRITNTLQLTGAVSYSDARFDEITRRASLGPAQESVKGKTDSSALSGTLFLRQEIGLGDSWLLGASAGVRANRMKSDGYTESDGVLQMSFGDVDWSWTRAEWGVDLRYRLDSSRWEPYVSVTNYADIVNETRSIAVGPGREFLADYEFSGGRGHGWIAGAGVGLKIADSSSLRFGVSLVDHALGKDTPSIRDSSASLSLVVDL